MNFIKRALTSITRTKRKSVILLLLVFILGNVVVGAITINKAVNNTERNIRMQVGGVSTLGLNTDDKDFDWEKVTPISEDAIKKIGQLPTVKDYDYGQVLSIPTESFINPDKKAFAENDAISLQGVNNPEILDFKTGKAKLVDGQVLSKDDLTNKSNHVLLSKDLAQAQHLSIGSTFKVNYAIPKSKVVLHYEFKVAGTYELLKKQETEKASTGKFLNQSLKNTIYMPDTTVKAMDKEIQKEIEKADPKAKKVSSAVTTGMPIYVLKDPLELQKFKNQAQAFLPKFYVISDSSRAFDAIAAPMKNMGWIANVVLYVAIAATLIILSLLITLFLRDRKHEIGIYLSLGEKKKKIIGQIIIEVLLVAVIGIGASLVTGNMVAKGMSEKMVTNQVSATKTGNGPADVDPLGGLGYGNITKEELIKSYHIDLDATTIGLFCGAELGSILISTMIPIIYVTRLKPKKVLM